MSADDPTVDYHGSPLDEVLADYFRTVDRGEPIDPEQLCEQHPHLAGALREYFSQERRVAPPGDETTAFYGPKSSGEPGTPSGALKVRCPHCNTPQSVSVDASLVDLRCQGCGSSYSLAGGDTRAGAAISRVGHFELIDRLGVGGFGSVWKARDTELDRVVAVKIPRRGGMTAEQTEKFLREARAAAQLSHPNIVAVHEVGRDGETVYIVSDLVRGVSLADWLTGQKLTGREAAELVATVADALEHAHQQGVVHRDLKPGNILVDGEGRPHLVDFGLARREAGEVTMTVEGQILGTPAYMSPEQARGSSHEADRRCDVYSLGVVLFELLTGELPFRGNLRMLLHQIIHDEPPSPRKFNAAIAKDLETITLRCLEKEPGKRFPSAAEARDELRRYLRGEPIRARPISRAARLVRWGKRNPTMATAAGLVVFLAVAGPLVALRLAQLQGSLRQRFDERVSLMETKTQEARRSAERIKRLEEQLSVWEGTANPWDFWPPKKDAPIRRTLAGDLLPHLRAIGADASLADAWTAREAALHRLAVATLCDVLGKTTEACASYRDVCRGMTDNPNLTADPTTEGVLAACHARLSQLLVEEDREEAEEHAEAARAIRERLAQQAPGEAPPQIAWLESEWALTRFYRFGTKSDGYGRVARIKQRLPEAWPNAPEESYRLVCYLAGVEPVLLNAAASGGRAAAVTDGPPRPRSSPGLPAP